MSILTIALDALDNPNDPDHAHGRAVAYDAIHDGDTLDTLEDRLAWMEDPTVSGTTYTAAYLAGYRAQIADWRAYDYAHRTAITHNSAYWEKPTPRLRGRALLDAKTVADATTAHCRRLGISQDAWTEATR